MIIYLHPELIQFSGDYTYHVEHCIDCSPAWGLCEVGRYLAKTYKEEKVKALDAKKDLPPASD